MPRVKLALIAALAVTAPLAVSAESQIFPASNEGQIEFMLPSNNIACIYTPNGGTSFYMPEGGGPELSCTRVEPSYVIVSLGPKGKTKRYNNPGEQGCCSIAPVLEYGNSWSKGPFSCLSSKSGLTCVSAEGHGFSLSRAKITTH